MKTAKKNPHAGHRDRVRERFLHEGLDHFEAHEILELILFYSVPRKDTNELAHRLMDHFDGSFSRVFDAPEEELLKVDGLSRSTAVLLKLFPEVCRRYLLDQRETGRVVHSAEDAADCLLPMFIGKKYEMVALMCVDAKGKVVYSGSLFEGSVNAAAVSVRRIVEVTVQYATADVILAHNHPSGIAVPSEEDIRVTEKIAQALKTVGIRLMDHLIVADGDWVSLASTPTLSSVFSGSRTLT